jgi:hypothetical protein
MGMPRGLGHKKIILKMGDIHGKRKSELTAIL